MDFTPTMQIFPAWAGPLIQGLSDLFLKHPRPVVMVVLLFCISSTVFKKIIDPQLYEFYKRILGYQSTLQLLKDELEENYEDYQWSDPDFCKAYLSLYAAYRELRMMAKRDYSGQIDVADERWMEFDRIQI